MYAFFTSLYLVPIDDDKNLFTLISTQSSLKSFINGSPILNDKAS